MTHSFKVGITRDFLAPDGTIGYGDIGLSILEQAPGLTFEFLAEDTAEIQPAQIRDYQGLLVLAPKITRESLEGNDQLRILARFGVGYDSVDVPACTRNGTLLTITPNAVRRPVAMSALTLLLSLSHKLLIKDRLTRTGNWNQRLNHMGQGLTGRTLGVIGVGNIGQEIFRLAQNFDLNFLGYDPFTDPGSVEELGVRMTSLEDLMRTADYIIVSCTLVPETTHLINAERLSLMKPSAYLINVSRGPVIDQPALYAALKAQQIQGAGLDVFEQEPVSPDEPLLELDNVILAPHSICWTDQFFEAIGREACQNIADLAQGKCPTGIVNRDALSHGNLSSLNATR